MLEERILIEVLAGGSKLLFEDGSKWEIDPGDAPRAASWAPSTVIAVEPAHEAEPFTFHLVNKASDVAVKARLERW